MSHPLYNGRGGAPHRQEFFALEGGLDLVTPALRKPPGRLIDARNYIGDIDGYRRYAGHERFDGRGKPSEASYSVLNYDQGTTAVAKDDTVTGAVSGAQGVALIAGVSESGSYAGGDAAGYLVLTDVTGGPFQDGENLQVSAATVSVADGPSVDRGADMASDDETWYRAAIERRRGLIAAVPGSGPVRGVWYYDGTGYAVRNNAGGTAGVLHESSATGWTAVDLGRRIDFDQGTAAFEEGLTVTGGTSSASATINRVVVTSGTWGNNDAAGYLVIGAVSNGPFQNNETITDSATGSATTDGADSAITLPAGGRYEFVTHNFYGNSDLERVYGVNGVGTAFEFDGTVFVPIETGMPTDTPNHLAVHNNHLFLSFPGGSLQFSSVGDPVTFNAVTGAGEIGIGTDITGLIGGMQSFLGILGETRTAYLVGFASNDFELRFLSYEAGGYEWSAQRMLNDPLYTGDTGIIRLRATETTGAFEQGALSREIEPVFIEKRKQGAAVTASFPVRATNEYRVFFDDNTAITLSLARREPQLSLLNYEKVVNCACSVPLAGGSEIVLIGDDEGMVYQDNTGTSLDGEAMTYYVRTAFAHMRSPGTIKRYHKARIHLDTTKDITLEVSAELGYANPARTEIAGQDIGIKGTGGLWGQATWGNFIWSSRLVGLGEVRLYGEGENIGVLIGGESTYEEPHTLHGITIHWTARRLVR